MTTSLPGRALGAVALAGALALALAPGAGADDGEQPSAKGPFGGTERRAAVAVLDRAAAVLDGTATAPDRSATMALREVLMIRGSLPPDLAARADAVLARPSDEGGTWVSDCATAPDVCVHYLQGADVGGGEYTVADVANTVQDIHDRYVEAGYREPLPDDGFGGSNQIDVYLEDLGDENLYGYCTSDDPKTNPEVNGYDVWAYCALDDDFSFAQFPSNTPLENMRVTAAHEYFHATQFAYDAWEDSWILEATATWAEDELYDDVDDNHLYNAHGPIAHPTIPLDTRQEGGLFQYGAWTFFRYLAEQLPQPAPGGVSSLVREMWERMDGSVGGPDSYSLQAVAEVLKTRGTNLGTMFARYSVANRAPALHYDEGAAYPTAPAKAVTVSGRAKNPAAFRKTLDHLTSSTVRYRPGNLRASNWRLGLKFDLAPRARGSAAVITVIKKSGARESGFVKLNPKGDAGVWVGFSSRKVSAVEVTLLNLSDRFKPCWTGDTPYSCFGGVPRDDNLKQSVDPVAYRP